MKAEMSVIGGVYRERCRLPENSDETWGSGGRAAAVIAGLGFRTRLYTEALIASLGATFGFEAVTEYAPISLQFQYDHALASPVIWPPIASIKKVRLKVEAECALVFGMLEAEVEVRADRIVYDPQNPLSPEALAQSADSTARIAYVLNGVEAEKLGRAENHEDAARRIVEDFGAAVVVVKRGAWGALVLDGERMERIPAYASKRVWPIGSGDVFAAVFAALWAAEEVPAIEAAHQASRAAALYVNDRVLPISKEVLTEPGLFPFEPIVLRDRALNADEFHVYLAGPFFSIAQRWLVEECRFALRGMGLRVFSPLHDVGLGHGHDVAPKDIEGLRACRTVLALVDGLDAGTVFEIGYARSLEKPVVVLAEVTPNEPLKMMTGTNCDVVSDFVTALYRTAWAARA